MIPAFARALFWFGQQFKKKKKWGEKKHSYNSKDNTGGAKRTKYVLLKCAHIHAKVILCTQLMIMCALRNNHIFFALAG